VKLKKGPHIVHVVSQGPHCLDGVTAAVVVTRFHPEATVTARFSSNSEINQTLLDVQCDPRQGHHSLWITDISWTDPAVDRHLSSLYDDGVEIYWIDHHRTALERDRRGVVTARFTDKVLDESYAACRLTFEYLAAQRDAQHIATELRQLVALADDNDRWLHRISGSRTLALAVSALAGNDAYGELLQMDATAQLTPRLQQAALRVDAELRRSSAIADATRTERHLAELDVTLVTAVCDGYASEIADRWSSTTRKSVYALYDARSLGVSFRRSPDCTVDLSALAQRLGGGGHPAAAGCELPQVRGQLAAAVADAVFMQLRK
jgi:oligoribonuclease NrnB/cAMP/cGMP phosphodiesterase (DHH superfamily)